MAKTILNVKTDKDVKERAQIVAKELGLPLSTVVNAFLKQFIREKEVVFSSGYTMTPYLEKKLSHIEKDIAGRKNMTGPFTTPQEIKKYLNSLKA